MWLAIRARSRIAIALFAAAILPASARATDVYPFQLYKQDAQFRKAIRSILGPNPPPWLAQLSGVQQPIAHVSIGPNGENHLAVHVCRPHNCDTSFAFILYSPQRGVAYGKMKVDGENSYLGRPTKDAQAALDSEFDPSGSESEARDAYERDRW